VYYGNLSNIKTFQDVVLYLKRFCLYLSIYFFCLYVWNQFISSPIELSELTEIKGVITEKWVHDQTKGPAQYRFRIETDDGTKLLRLNKTLVSGCCFMDKVLLNKKVTVLIDWNLEGIILYQLSYGNNLILIGDDVISKGQEGNSNYLQILFWLLFCGGVMYVIEYIIKKRKRT